MFTSIAASHILTLAYLTATAVIALVAAIALICDCIDTRKKDTQRKKAQ